MAGYAPCTPAFRGATVQPLAGQAWCTFHSAEPKSTSTPRCNFNDGRIHIQNATLHILRASKYILLFTNASFHAGYSISDNPFCRSPWLSSLALHVRPSNKPHTYKYGWTSLGAEQHLLAQPGSPDSLDSSASCSSYKLSFRR